MPMTPRLRKLVLTAHVTSSVGWLGAVAVSFALGVAGLTSQDAQTVRGAYLTLELTGWFVLVPLSLASLLTGLVQSLGTTWGLFRHYWVLFQAPDQPRCQHRVAAVHADAQLPGRHRGRTTSSSGDLAELRNPSPVLHAGGALLLLLVATTLAVYKPRGMTRYGQRKQHERRRVLVP